jgi:hypothetical protein
LLKLECSAKACGNLGICNDPAGGALWIVSQFENYSFRSPNDPAKREREASRTHPENVSLTMPLQGVLPRQRHFAAATAFKEKCMEENSLKLHGKGHIFEMLRLALIPPSPGLARRSAGQV